MSQIHLLDSVERQTLRWLAAQWQAAQLAPGKRVWAEDVEQFLISIGAEGQYPRVSAVLQSLGAVLLFACERVEWIIQCRAVLMVRELDGAGWGPGQPGEDRQNDSLAAMDATMPAAVRNWLTARYLADPTPEPSAWDGEPVVFVRYEDFAGFLVGAGVELLPNLDDWKNAGWIEDVRVDLKLTDNPTNAPPYAVARLNLPMGRHRLVGIRRTVLDAPTKSAAPPNGTQQGEGETPKPDDKPDGPFDADGFRFAGVEVKFGRAGKQYRLVMALWDAKRKRPAPPRPVDDVITEVWGDETETEDSTFRQLCADARRRFQAANCPLDIQQTNGKVQLSLL